MFKITPMSHVAARFSHAVQMVAELPSYVEDEELPRVVQIACLEDWATNHRLLTEFLLLRPPSNCSSARDFVPGWSPRGELVDRLKRDYGWISEDVSHIGSPKELHIASPAEFPDLLAKTTDLLALVAQFTEALTASESDHADMVGGAYALARAELERQRLIRGGA